MMQGTDMGMDDGGDGARAPALTVARIPVMVREVDAIVQTFEVSRLPTDPEHIVELCESLLARIEEIDDFRQTLRPGPLEAIVHKQVSRLSTVLEHLHASGASAGNMADRSAQATREPVVLVDEKRHRQVVVPVPGSLLVRRAPSHHIRPGSASKQLTVRLPRHPKPIYKWEKRSATRFIPSHNSPHFPRQFMDDDATEATMELRPCREPGHYVRSSMAFTMVPEAKNGEFEFQLLLTEAEFKALKFQRRQLRAEQRHLQRQQPKSSS